jgi:AcrR family transcriptional regulator
VTDEKRTYRKQRRAELEQATRLRITESAVALHGTLGPSRTSLAAVAEHAGVRRSTLYRHFPDEAALFHACSAHWLAAYPRPDPGRWAAIADPDRRLRAALRELYALYRSGERMLANLHRDEASMPVVGERMRDFHDYLETVRRVLAAGRPARGGARRRLHAALGHAIAFSTWRSLAIEQRLGDAQAAELMCGLVAAGERPAGRR